MSSSIEWIIRRSGREEKGREHERDGRDRHHRIRHQTRLAVRPLYLLHLTLAHSLACVQIKTRLTLCSLAFALVAPEPMNRLAVISTSRTNWPKEISEEPETLACHLAEVIASHKAPKPSVAVKEDNSVGPATNSLGGLSLNDEAGEEGNKIPGIYETNEESKIAVLASSVEVGNEAEEGTTSVRKSRHDPPPHTRHSLTACSFPASATASGLPRLQVHDLGPHLPGWRFVPLQRRARTNYRTVRAFECFTKHARPGVLGTALQSGRSPLYVPLLLLPPIPLVYY